MPRCAAVRDLSRFPNEVVVINFAIAAAIAAIVTVVAVVMRGRATSDAPTQRAFTAPIQLDRSDFGTPTEQWLVVVFTSATCQVCADVVAKAQALESSTVAIREIEFAMHRDLHDKYAIDAVPTLVIADSSGVVRRHFLGPVTATDLWAGVAEARSAYDC